MAFGFGGGLVPSPRISLYIQMLKNMKTSKSKFRLVPVILVKGYSASMKSDGDNYLVRK